MALTWLLTATHLGSALLHSLSTLGMGVYCHHVDWCDVACSMQHLFLGSGLLVEQVEVCLPANGDNTTEDAPVLDRHVGEAEGRHCWPDLAAVPPTCWHGVADALDDFGEGCAGKEGLHAEKVRVEQRGKECLVYEDLVYRQYVLSGRRKSRGRTLMDKESVLDR